jgi:hypothetical protein
MTTQLKINFQSVNLHIVIPNRLSTKDKQEDERED